MREEAVRLPHDAVWKAVFSEKSFAQSLLAEFVPAARTPGLDLNTLELASAAMQTANMRRLEEGFTFVMISHSATRTKSQFAD